MRQVRASMAAVLTGGLLTGGCAGQTVLCKHFVHIGYSPTEFGVGAGRKDLKTVLHGDPFGVGEAEFAAATIALLNRHQPFLQPTHFTTTPGKNASPRHRMVLVFDQPRIPVYQLCRDRLLGQIVFALFPPINPNEDDEPLFLARRLRQD